MKLLTQNGGHLVEEWLAKQVYQENVDMQENMSNWS